MTKKSDYSIWWIFHISATGAKRLRLYKRRVWDLRTKKIKEIHSGC